MSKTPRRLPIRRILEHIARELEMSSTVFSVAPGFRAAGRGETTPFGRLELPLGVAPGPHTQSAQNLAAAYVAGARFFGLKTVSQDPDDLAPEDALGEFLKGKFLIALLGRELGLGEADGAVFAMHVAGDLGWLTGPRMTAFFDAMEDASGQPLWHACIQAGREALGRFNNLDGADLADLDPQIAKLAVLEWRDAAEMERAALYLLEGRGLHTYLQVTPQADLDAAAPAVERLHRQAGALGLGFGLSIAATSAAEGLELAARCAERWPGVPMAYTGGADFFNLRALAGLGFCPVCVDRTLEKPGGYLRLRQLARALGGVEMPGRVEPAAARALGRKLSGAGEDQPQRLRLPGKAPMIDCFTAPCRAGCPFGMDIPGALRLMSDGRCRDALRVILDKNPLPHLTGALCPQPCRDRCTRLDYDQAIQVRRVEALCAGRAWEDLLPRLEPEEHRVGCRVAVVGDGPGAMAAALLFARRGVSTTLFVPGGRLCRRLVEADPGLAPLVELDAQLLEVMGVDVRLEAPPVDPEALLKNGYSHVALEGDRRPGVFFLDPGDGEAGIAQSIRDAHRAVEAVVGPAPARPRPAGRRGGAMGKKGKLRMAGDPEDECERCLECATVCENCVDVCPNRANVPITVLTRGQPQILHLDALCDGCGLCAQSCPYEGAPWRDKFTLFETVEDFEHSDSAGFVVLDFLAGKVRLRLEGRVWDVSLKDADSAVPSQIEELMETVFTDYPYLLP